MRRLATYNVERTQFAAHVGRFEVLAEKRTDGVWDIGVRQTGERFKYCIGDKYESESEAMQAMPALIAAAIVRSIALGHRLDGSVLHWAKELNLRQLLEDSL